MVFSIVVMAFMIKLLCIDCQVIKQMWPFIGEYVSNLLKTSVEKSIRDHLKSFLFENIDIGDCVRSFSVLLLVLLLI